ncbi:MAG: PAS domain S-box protein, partial [Oscillospiraceae bacterium]
MKSKEIQNELWDLFNKGISGGIMCTYADSDGFPVHFINDGMLNYLGYSREEFYKLYEKNTVKLVYKDDVEQVLLKIKEMLPEKKDYEICFRVIKKDGTFIWMVERVRFLNNFEGRKIMLGLFLDITQMMMLQEKLKNQAATLEEQSEELSLQNEELIKQRDMLKNQTHELEISEERFRIALAKISCTIFEYDIEGGKTIRFGTNKNFKESAISMGDAGEKIILNGVIDDDYTENFKQIFEKIKKGSVEESCIIKVLPLNGKEIWDKISLTAIFDKNGSPIRAIGMIEDVTTQKETEIAFKKEEQ